MKDTSLSLSEYLDKPWKTTLKNIKEGKRHSMSWCLKHLCTKELLNSNVLNGNVLDIGCGIGQRSFIACETNKCNIVGIDGSECAINYANKNYKNINLSFIVGDITKMPFNNNYFDNAFMLAVIEHVKDTNLLINEIKRVITSKGKIFISVTENDYHSSPDHVHSFSTDTICKAFKGLKIINHFVKDHIIFLTIENK